MTDPAGLRTSASDPRFVGASPGRPSESRPGSRGSRVPGTPAAGRQVAKMESTWNPIRLAGRWFAQGGADTLERVAANLTGSQGGSEVSGLIGHLNELLQSQDYDIEEVKELIAELKQKKLSPQQLQALSKLEEDLDLASGNYTVALTALQRAYTESGNDIGALFQKGLALWKGTDESGESTGGGGLGDAIMGPLMGSPTRPLGAARDALKDFKNNKAVVEALDALIGEDDDQHTKEKKALKGKTFEPAERDAILELRRFVDRRVMPLNKQEMAHALAVLEKYCEIQAAEGIVPKAMGWVMEEAPDKVRASVMGAAEKLLVRTLDIVKNSSENGVISRALTNLLISENEKKALRKKEFSEQERAVIGTLARLASERAPLSAEQRAPVVKILERYRDAQIAEGIVPSSIQWAKTEGPAAVRKFWHETALPAVLETAAETLGPLDQETALARFADDFCKDGFATPRPPSSRRKGLEEERTEFVKRTVQFLVKDYGSFSQFFMKPWLNWYIKGFEEKVFARISPLIEQTEPSDNQTELYERLQLSLLTDLEAYLKNRFGKEDQVTPAELFAEMTRDVVDNFAPRFHSRQKVATAFGNLPFIFAPISWVLQSFCFLSDSICNAIALPLLKRALVKNNVIVKLLNEANESLGLGTLHPHGLHRILCKRLEDGFEALKKGGTPAPTYKNPILGRRLAVTIESLVAALDIRVAKGPEAFADKMMKKKVETALVTQLSDLFQLLFQRDRIEDTIHIVYELMNESLEKPSEHIALAGKQQLETRAMESLDKIIFLGAHLAIEEELDKPASLRRTAARFLVTVQKHLQDQDITEEDLENLQSEFLPDGLVDALDEKSRTIFTEALQKLEHALQPVEERVEAEPVAAPVERAVTPSPAIQPAAEPVNEDSGTDSPFESVTSQPPSPSHSKPKRLEGSIAKKMMGAQLSADPEQPAEVEVAAAEPAAVVAPAPVQQQEDPAQVIAKWKGDFDPFKALGVKPFDPKSMVGAATRLAYLRYQPLTREAMSLISHEKFLEGLVEYLCIRPMLGKR